MPSFPTLRRAGVFGVLALVLTAGTPALDARTVPQIRGSRDLDGAWLFQTNGAPAGEWKVVHVPSDFESHEGTDFNGVGWYRREVDVARPREGRRVWLEFQAAATDADVWWNGEYLGGHLGGWTPFRFDITDLLRRAPTTTNEIRIRLDEKVGHNTQGFLPIVQPHFGGLWQSVRLRFVNATSMDDLRMRAVGNTDTGELELEIPLLGDEAATANRLAVTYGQRGARGRTRVELGLGEKPTGSGRPAGRLRRDGSTLFANIPVTAPALWWPESPTLYDLVIELLPAAPGMSPLDRVTATAAFRKVETDGHRLRLNGRPLNVRGLLNWGYYPPRLAPIPDPARFQRDLEFARRQGFNLIKFCLWVPPKRYLEMCDEFGMLAWMEYPTWHPKFTPEHLEPLRREFTEFFAFDRNHPSVILRSLTCETGPGADLEVIRSLYDTAKRMIPGAIVEDDSSWIEWNRISDIWDDHPYGNNHTWVATLRRLNRYIAEREAKPLVLGEAIAADTWPNLDRLTATVGAERPYWLPRSLDAQIAWRARMEGIVGTEPLRPLEADSLRYAQLMRKYQAETFRREVPFGGYVISVIRDFPLASMGLLDYLDQPKWPDADWAWHGDTVCLLQTENDRRSFASGQHLRGKLRVSHFGRAAIEKGRLEVSVAGARVRTVRSQENGTLVDWLELDLPLPRVEAGPRRVVVEARLRTHHGESRNAWPVWVVPAANDLCPNHVWVAPELAAKLALPAPAQPEADTALADVVIAPRLDDALARRLEAGGRVLLLAAGGPASFKVVDHWFLRGAPVVDTRALGARVPRELLVELQHFDLASGVIPDLPWLEQMDPLLMLWDTHDHGGIKTHGLIFETRVGEGRLLVSAVNHAGTNNAAGRWLLGELVRHLGGGPAPKAALATNLWAGIRAKLHDERLSLTGRDWRFHPEPKETVAPAAWAAPDFDDSGWATVKVGQHWEGQGWPALDGWAWYRLRVDVPATWTGRPIYLTFEGVDDLYELYLDGRLFAKRGDLAARVDTFNERFSHDLRDVARPGQPLTIAVRVHDWYGAGGIFRPVTLGTTPWAPELDVFESAGAATH